MNSNYKIQKLQRESDDFKKQLYQKKHESRDKLSMIMT
jgi:hypothetical protein